MELRDRINEANEPQIECPALRRRISETRCVIVKRDNLKLFGERSAFMTGGCPCEKEEDMPIRYQDKDGNRVNYKSIGTCPVCGRPEMRLYPKNGVDMCGTCKGKIVRGRMKEAKTNTLEKDVKMPETAKETKLEFKIELVFSGADVELYDDLTDYAAKYRRDPAQQILWDMAERIRSAA
jgi:uncharacterized Zn finger protein (UPF0148 family)